jgi:histone H3/H4
MPSWESRRPGFNLVLASRSNSEQPDIRRLARRGGCKRVSCLFHLSRLTRRQISAAMYDGKLWPGAESSYSFLRAEVRGCLRNFLEKVIRDSVTYMEHSKRKTVRTD